MAGSRTVLAGAALVRFLRVAGRSFRQPVMEREPRPRGLKTLTVTVVAEQVRMNLSNWRSRLSLIDGLARRLERGRIRSEQKPC